ncbi:hypothetical protein [Streptomyces jumonjinensis]
MTHTDPEQPDEQPAPADPTVAETGLPTVTPAALRADYDSYAEGRARRERQWRTR